MANWNRITITMDLVFFSLVLRAFLYYNFPPPTTEKQQQQSHPSYPPSSYMAWGGIRRLIKFIIVISAHSSLLYGKLACSSTNDPFFAQIQSHQVPFLDPMHHQQQFNSRGWTFDDDNTIIRNPLSFLLSSGFFFFGQKEEIPHPPTRKWNLSKEWFAIITIIIHNKLLEYWGLPMMMLD